MRAWPIITASVALAACGGSGAASTGPGSGPQVPALPPAPSTAPAPTTTPTPKPVPLYAGRVLDADHGNAPIGGATVTVGTGFAYTGAGYALSGVTATVSSNADGTFAILPSGATYVQITAPGVAPAHRPIAAATNFAGFDAAAFAPALFRLPTPNADELGGLAEVNINRAKFGAGSGALALSLDADLIVAARAFANDMAANGYLAHTKPGTAYAYFSSAACQLGSFCFNPFYDDENIAGGTTAGAVTPGAAGFNLASTNDAYIGQGPADGHYQRVLNATNIFVGLGASYNGIGLGGAPYGSYFVEGYAHR